MRDEQQKDSGAAGENRIVEIQSAIAFFDGEEIIENCTVQILTNSETGEVSVGWWRNEA
jgi:hypothetical protein